MHFGPDQCTTLDALDAALALAGAQPTTTTARLRLGFVNTRGRVREADGRAATHTFSGSKSLDALLMSETWTYGDDLSAPDSAYRHIRGTEQAAQAGTKHRLTLGMNALVTDGGQWRWHHMAELDTDHTQWLKASSTANSCATALSATPT